MSENTITVTLSTPGQVLLKLANGRSKQKRAAEQEIYRRVEKRHLAGKFVTNSMQKVANRVADRMEKDEAKANTKADKAIKAELLTRKAELDAHFAEWNAAWENSGLTLAEVEAN